MREGGKHANPAKLAPCKSLFSGSTDWRLLVDYTDLNIVLPPEIVATSQRPDIVIWSTALKKVIMIELTCPAEEGIVIALPSSHEDPISTCVVFIVLRIVSNSSCSRFNYSYAL